MQISSNTLSRQTQKVITKNLARVFTEIKNPNEATQFLTDFFTDTEQTVMMKRLAIAVLLDHGKSYGEIKNELNVSSATISSVVEMIKKPGVKIALQRIQEDEWAERFLENLQVFKK